MLTYITSQRLVEKEISQGKDNEAWASHTYVAGSSGWLGPIKLFIKLSRTSERWEWGSLMFRMENCIMKSCKSEKQQEFPAQFHGIKGLNWSLDVQKRGQGIGISDFCLYKWHWWDVCWNITSISSVNKCFRKCWKIDLLQNRATKLT